MLHQNRKEKTLLVRLSSCEAKERTGGYIIVMDSVMKVYIREKYNELQISGFHTDNSYSFTRPNRLLRILIGG